MTCATDFLIKGMFLFLPGTYLHWGAPRLDILSLFLLSGKRTLFQLLFLWRDSRLNTTLMIKIPLPSERTKLLKISQIFDLHLILPNVCSLVSFGYLHAFPGSFSALLFPPPDITISAGGEQHNAVPINRNALEKWSG